MAKMSAEEKKWRAESDASTLKRAMEIQKDPNRHKEAQRCINQELLSLAKITGHKIVTPSRPQKRGK